MVIEFGADGSILDSTIHPTVLQNPIRLTYEEVEAILNESGVGSSLSESGVGSVLKESGVSSSLKESDVSSSRNETSTTPSTKRPFTSTVHRTISSPYTTLQPLAQPLQNQQRWTKRREIASNASVLGFASSNSALPASTDAIFQRVASPDVTALGIRETLTTLYGLARRRRLYREQRGCIDFSFPEARFHVKEGQVEGCIQNEDMAGKAENLVMEMMVAAGEVIGLIGKENVGEGGKCDV